MRKFYWLFSLIICIALSVLPAFAAAKDVVTVEFYDVNNSSYLEQSVTTVDLVYNGEVLSTDVPAFIDRGRTLVPIYIIGDLLNADVKWDQEFRRATIQTSNTMVILTIGSNIAHVNGKKVELPNGVPAALVQFNGSDRTMVPWRFVAEQLGAQVKWDPDTYSVTLYFESVLPPVIEETPETPSDESDEAPTEEQPQETPEESIEEDASFSHKFETIEDAVIILDAGHGGDDPGAVYYDVLEKDVNFSVMQKVYELLSEQGMTVHLTREEDIRVSLDERTEFANELVADVFVSMHSNAADQASAKGIETYYYSEDPLGEILARYVQDAVIESTGAKDRETKTANFYVCKNTEMPAVLVEMGFLTNKSECQNLTDEEYQMKLAEGIVNGILDYLNSVIDEKTERSNDYAPFSYDLDATASSLNRRVMHQIPAKPTSAYTMRLINAP